MSDLNVPGVFVVDAADWPPSGGSGYSQRLQVFRADSKASIFKKGSGNTVLLRAGSEIEFLGALYAPTSDQSVTLPTLVAGTDYRIAIKTDGSLEAYTYAATLPTGAKIIGGFHHLPGAPATGLSTGGNTTPTILEWSIWDIGFRPKCDPRGMTRVFNAGFWIDIYFQGDSSNADGVSRNDDYILRGSNPPIVPSDYGGNGTTQYSNFTFWVANEHLARWGKRLPSYSELCLAAYGTNEGAGRGNHPIKTGFAKYNTAAASSDPNFTSKCGGIQMSGCVWAWTSTFASWVLTPTTDPLNIHPFNVADGRGQLLMQQESNATVLLHGGSHVYTAAGLPPRPAGVAGSRCMETIEKPGDSSGDGNVAARGASDHYCAS